MTYSYEKEKACVFTDEGQKKFLHIRDEANRLCRMAGACSVERLIAGATGDSFEMLACIDRLVELKEFKWAMKAQVAQHSILVKSQGGK